MSNTELSELHVKNILNKISSNKNLTYPDAIVIFKKVEFKTIILLLFSKRFQGKERR
jgi:hypothetical protein